MSCSISRRPLRESMKRALIRCGSTTTGVPSLGWRQKTRLGQMNGSSLGEFGRYTLSPFLESTWSREEIFQYRLGRLRLHGPDAFQRVQAGQRLLRRPLSPGPEGGLRADSGRRPGLCRQLGLRVGRDRLAEADRARKDSDRSPIDICTPNTTHAEIAIAAAEKGKMVLCEKPLSMNLVEGQKMVDVRSRRPPFPTWSGTTTAACRR